MTLAEAQALAKSSQPKRDLPVVVDARVVEQVNKLIGTEKGRAFMKRGLANLAPLRDGLAGPLKAKGLPEGLLAVALIESAVTNMPETDGRPSLAPGMRGAGVWMFIPETARRYGLEVSATRDERLDVTRETQAAAALLSDLYTRYSDWRLALAAYNAGPSAVERYGYRVPPFAETRSYVSRIRSATGSAPAGRSGQQVYKVMAIVDGRSIPSYSNVLPSRRSSSERTVAAAAAVAALGRVPPAGTGANAPDGGVERDATRAPSAPTRDDPLRALRHE